MSTPLSTLPLEGVRVIDFGQYVAGPLAGMLLAEQGAEVIRIDPPGDIAKRRPADVVLGRGKKSIVLDLRLSSDRDTAMMLIRTADVMIENFRPNLLKKFGLDIETVRATNPRLICLSMPGFASGDQRRSHVPGWEGVVGAATALYSDMNMMRGLLQMAPAYSALPLPSVYAAVHGALAVTMALNARRESGNGSAVEVPLANAMMSAMGGIILYVDGQPSRYDLPPIPRLLKKIAVPLIRRKLARKPEAAQEAFYNKLSGLTPPMMDSYKCRDGRLLYIFAMDHSRMSRDLLSELGILDRFIAAGLKMSSAYEGKPKDGKTNLADVSLLAMKWRKQLRAAMQETFLKEDADIWENRLNGKGIPCAIQRTTAEWLNLPQISEAGLIETIQDPKLGPVKTPAKTLWLEGTRRNAMTAAPAYDQDRSNILTALSVDPSQDSIGSASPKSNPFMPLHGIKVLDLSTMVAGPVCARTLADYGAEVIKIDSPAPFLGPRMTCWYGIEVNQGKKSILLDLKKQEGLDAFKKMVLQADVVVHNMRPGVAERLGIDYDALHAIKPGLIYCNISAYGTGTKASWEERPGYDPVLQAATGIMSRFGQPERPEMHGVASCVDYVTGFNAAFGISAALLRRLRTGEGARIYTSLAQGSHLAQITYAYTHKDRAWTEPAGQRSRGVSSLNRFYQTKRGWIYLVLPRHHADRLLKLKQFGSLVALLQDYQAGMSVDDKLDAAIETILRGDTAVRWETILQNVQLGAHRAVSIDDLRSPGARLKQSDFGTATDIHNNSTAVVEYRNHPEGLTAFIAQAAAPMFSGQHLPILSPAPKFGHHTMEILSSIGLSEKDISSLFQSKTAANSLSTTYLPG